MDKEVIFRRTTKMGAKIVMLGTIAVAGEALGKVSAEMANEAVGNKQFKKVLKGMTFEDLFGIK